MLQLLLGMIFSMKVLILGGSGFLGKYLTKESIDRGYDTTIFDINSVNIDGVDFIKGDILSKSDIFSVVSGMDIVYNLSAVADIDECIKDPVKCVECNILGNVNVMEACVKHNVKRFIFASSVYAGGNQGGFYASSKKSSEILIKDYNKYYDLQYTILRYGTLFGTGAPLTNSITKHLTEAIQNGEINYVGDGSEVRELIHVEDASNLSFDVLKNEYKNKTIALVGNHRIKMSDLFMMIKEMLHDDIKIQYNTDLTRSRPELLHYKITPCGYERDNVYKLLKSLNRELSDSLIEIMEEVNGGY